MWVGRSKTRLTNRNTPPCDAGGTAIRGRRRFFVPSAVCRRWYKSLMQVVLIPGDGIGPEVTEAAKAVVAAAGVVVDWIVAPAGADCVAQFGDPLPESTLDHIRRYRVALKGPC